MKVSDLVIVKGNYITVVKWKHAYANGVVDQSYVGDCMKITEVDGNLLRVKRLSNFKHNSESFTLNMDKVVVRKLSNDFVQQVKNDLK